MKKLLSMILTIALCMSLFVGCAAKSEEGTTEDKKEEAKEVVSAEIDETAAITVNEAKVTNSMAKMGRYLVKRSMEQQANQYGMPIDWSQDLGNGTTFNDAGIKQLKDMLVRIEVCKNIANEKGIELSEENKTAVENAVNDFKTNVTQEEIDANGLNADVYKAYVEGMLLSYDVALASVTDEEITEEALENALMMNPDYQKIKKYGEDHYFDTVTASHILISTKDDEGKDLDEDKKAEAKAKADEILEKIKNGEDFATLAKENSADPGSKDNGGELGSFGYGQMVPVFEETAFALEPGEVSEVVESDYGYHIIKVTDKVLQKEEDMKNVDEIKAKATENAKMQLKLQLFEEKYEKMLVDYKVETTDTWNDITFIDPKADEVKEDDTNKTEETAE